MVLASGVNFGIRRSMPHIFGISIGFFVLCLASGLGLGSFLQAFPQVHFILKLIAAAYLVYLALKIASSRSISDSENPDTQPMTLLQAALFQCVNPKAIMMAITAMIMFSLAQHPLYSTLWISMIYAVICFPCIVVWAMFGTLLKQYLSEPTRLKYFNISMGLLLLVSIYPILK